MLIMILGAVLAAVLFYYFFVKPYNYWTERGVQQGETAWFFGDNWKTLTKRQSLSEMVTYVYNKCPGVRYSGTYQFSKPVLLLKDPDLIKQITVKDFDHFTDHNRVIPEDVDPLWTRNLVGLKGQKWHDMRSILSPSFTSSKMRAMFVLIRECAGDFVQHFLKKDEEIVTVEMKDIFTRFTNDVIATTAFGVKVNSLDQPNNEFYLMGKKATNFTGIWKTIKFILCFICPKLFLWFKIELFNREVSAFFKDLVDESIKTREEKGIVRPDMINLLMEARKGIQKHEENEAIDTGFATALESNTVKGKIPMELTNVDITAQALIFFFAGFETVSGLMCFAAYELAANPDIQQKLRMEINATLHECGGKVTYEGLMKMKYMDMVISEALRKWPIAVATDRVCTKPYTIEPATPEEKPLRLEKGALVWFPIFGIHHDPEHFPNPERFNPDRFSDENKGDVKPYTYFPFGLGPRNCIGSRFALLETKAVFFHVLQHFEIVPVEKSEIPLKVSRKVMSLTAEGGFWFGLKRIQNECIK